MLHLDVLVWCLHTRRCASSQGAGLRRFILHIVSHVSRERGGLESQRLFGFKTDSVAGWVKGVVRKWAVTTRMCVRSVVRDGVKGTELTTRPTKTRTILNVFTFNMLPRSVLVQRPIYNRWWSRRARGNGKRKRVSMIGGKAGALEQYVACVYA
jgi:hypothetical protein